MIKSDFNNGDKVKFRDYRTGYIHQGIVGLKYPIIGMAAPTGRISKQTREEEQKEVDDMVNRTIWVYDDVNRYSVDLSMTREIEIIEKSETEMTWQEVLEQFCEVVEVDLPDKNTLGELHEIKVESHSDNS